MVSKGAESCPECFPDLFSLCNAGLEGPWTRQAVHCLPVIRVERRHESSQAHVQLRVLVHCLLPRHPAVGGEASHRYTVFNWILMKCQKHTDQRQVVQAVLLIQPSTLTWWLLRGTWLATAVWVPRSAARVATTRRSLRSLTGSSAWPRCFVVMLMWSIIHVTCCADQHMMCRSSGSSWTSIVSYCRSSTSL